MMKVKAILTLFLIPLVVMGQEPTDYKHWDMFDAYLGKPNEDYGRLGIKEVRRYSVTKEGQKDKWIGQDSFDLNGFLVLQKEGDDVAANNVAFLQNIAGSPTRDRSK